MLTARALSMLCGAVLAAGALGVPSPLAAAPAAQTPVPVPSGCGASFGASVTLDPGASGNTLRTPYSAVVGVPFSLTLDSNRTTGYQWELAEPLDTTVLQLDSHVYNRPSATMPGAGGTETWTFTPMCSGATTVSLVYRRPWEAANNSDRRQIYDIGIQ